MTLPGRWVFAAVLGLMAALGSAGSAMAQSLDAAVEDLRAYDVTFEEGALTEADLADLDRTVAGLQERAAFFKVVVLAEPVDRYPSTAAFAGAVLDDLGGGGRVLVISTSDVGLASDVDPPAEVRQAEQDAAAAANAQDSFAAGALAAGRALGVPDGAAPPVTAPPPGTPSGTTGGSRGSGGGGFPVVLVVLAVLVVGGGVLLFLQARRGRARAAAANAQVLGEAELRVRRAVDAAANQVLELSDVVERPDAPPAARTAYREGATLFAELQDDLEAADTRAELEAVYPEVVRAGWLLDTAAARLAGRPEPPAPSPAPLFPAPAPPPTSAVSPASPPGPPPAARAPAPEPHYRGFEVSPWLTTAAMAAIQLLRSQRGAPAPSYRPAVDDDLYGKIFGGGGSKRRTSGGLARSRPRIAIGGERRGMGARGMGRR